MGLIFVFCTDGLWHTAFYPKRRADRCEKLRRIFRMHIIVLIAEKSRLFKTYGVASLYVGASVVSRCSAAVVCLNE